jgi:uncharacterized peroxidase-related enzyme
MASHGPLRLDYRKLSPGAYRGFGAVHQALSESRLDAQLIELVNLRISQINGCAFCLEMHAALLRERGCPADKLDSLAGWHASAGFTERERVALEWAESLTRVSETHAPDAVFEALKPHFSDAEISDLTMAVALMNAFNRLAVGMRQ